MTNNYSFKIGDKVTITDSPKVTQLTSYALWGIVPGGEYKVTRVNHQTIVVGNGQIIWKEDARIITKLHRALK